MNKENRVANIMSQFQGMQDTENDEDLAFINGETLDAAINGLKGVKRNISPNLLKPHPKNVFSMVHDEEYETLKKAIAEYGITNPIICYPDGSEYIILSGHRRTACAKELGLKTVPVKVVEPFKSEVDALTFLGIENMSTRNPSPIDIATFADMLSQQLDLEGFTGRKRDLIAERIPSIKGRMVQSYMKLLKLPDQYKDWVHLGYMTVKQGEKIVSFYENYTNEYELFEFEESARVIADMNIPKEAKQKKFKEAFKDLSDAISKNTEKPKKQKRADPAIAKANKQIKEIIANGLVIPKKLKDQNKALKEIDELRKSLDYIEKEIKYSIPK